MVGCENDDCEFEWFHLQCVGLTEEVRACTHRGTVAFS